VLLLLQQQHLLLLLHEQLLLLLVVVKVWACCSSVTVLTAGLTSLAGVGCVAVVVAAAAACVWALLLHMTPQATRGAAGHRAAAIGQVRMELATGCTRKAAPAGQRRCRQVQAGLGMLMRACIAADQERGFCNLDGSTAADKEGMHFDHTSQYSCLGSVAYSLATTADVQCAGCCALSTSRGQLALQALTRP
jgi:hypothetical protein